MEKIGSEYNHQLLEENFNKAIQDKDFINLVKKFKIDKKELMKYTSKLENTTLELNNCKNCRGLGFCKNLEEGYVNMPVLYNNRLIFSLAPCQYQKALEAKKIEKTKISMKDIKVDDQKRVPIIKWMTKFLEESKNLTNKKGLYLHGNFGSGKTFLITALFNELEKNRNTCEIAYFPELLSDLKSNFLDFEDKMDYYKNVDYLLLDDIGAEKVTEWGRDEVLGTILQYRMTNEKITFFTSNLSIQHLEQHLSTSNYDVDKLKARRIIERIKNLTDYLELESKNRREE